MATTKTVSRETAYYWYRATGDTEPVTMILKGRDTSLIEYLDDDMKPKKMRVRNARLELQGETP